MKCPERFELTQININKYGFDNIDRMNIHGHILIEKQKFAECYQEECVAWDKEKQICRKHS